MADPVHLRVNSMFKAPTTEAGDSLPGTLQV